VASRFEPNPQFITRVVGELEGIGKRLGAGLVGEITKVLNVRQPVAFVTSKKTGNRYIVGLEPSEPGEPPKMLTGRLRDSISYAVERDGNKVVVNLRAATNYAARLEFGFVGVDRLGRRYTQAPRPYMLSTISKEWQRVLYEAAKG
jgi:hypothetical protein